MSWPSQDAPRPSLPGDLDRLLHDLRGPLNSAVMHLEILKRVAPDDPTARQSVQTIQQELARLATLLPLAFGICALEMGQRTRVDLGAVVERVVRGADVTVAPPPWPEVHGDPDLIALALGHLVTNAVEATPAAGPGRRPPHVSAGTQPSGDVTVVVRDWGRGLTTTNPKALVRLTASTKPGRAGAGLMTADRVARLHGGALELALPADGGVEARLIFPKS